MLILPQICRTSQISSETCCFADFGVKSPFLIPNNLNSQNPGMGGMLSGVLRIPPLKIVPLSSFRRGKGNDAKHKKNSSKRTDTVVLFDCQHLSSLCVRIQTKDFHWVASI